MTPRSQLNLERQLESIPIQNNNVLRVDSTPGQPPLLEVSLRYAWWLAPFARLLKLRRRRRIQLDPAGWGVYSRIDGQKTFEQLVDEFAAEHKLDFLESRALLMAHIRNLMRAGLVVVGVRS